MHDFSLPPATTLLPTNIHDFLIQIIVNLIILREI
jgi:hypothetical protein